MVVLTNGNEIIYGWKIYLELLSKEEPTEIPDKEPETEDQQCQGRSRIRLKEVSHAIKERKKLKYMDEEVKLLLTKNCIRA